MLPFAHTRRTLLRLALWAALAVQAGAVTVTGNLLDRAGLPVADASVVVPDGSAYARTDAQGVFTIELQEATASLRVVAGDREPIELAVPSPLPSTWKATLPFYLSPPVELETLVVMPSQFPVGDLPGAPMTAVEAALSPGSLADINRALQMLPGVDAQDEGDALYVRGGDALETGLFLNGSRFQQIKDQESPLGTFVGTLSPFLAESIRFEAGGFGAGRGNLLSALVEVETQGAPDERKYSLNAGLGAISAEADLPFHKGLGVRLTGTWTDVKPILAVNGSNQSLLREPRGHDLSALLGYRYGTAGSLKLFGLEQTHAFAVEVPGARGTGIYAADTRLRQTWASWKDDWGALQPRVDASYGRLDKHESMGAWDWRDRRGSEQVSGKAQMRLGEKAQGSAGWEYELNEATLRERYGTWTGSDFVRSERGALWAEADFMAMERLRVIAGWRVEQSNRGGGFTHDPRLAAGLKLARHLDLSAAYGVYHQRPDAVNLSWLRHGGDQPSQKATHAIAALAWQQRDWLARLEVYQKHYTDLSLLGDQRRVRTGGVGKVNGAELSGRFPLPWAWTGRFSASLVDAARTDADTGLRAPYGIGYSTAWIVQREFGKGYQVGLTWRQAAGKRYTPVAGALIDPGTGSYEPVFGPPNSATLKPLRRLDLLLTRIKDLTTNVNMITYVSVSNVLGAENEYDVTYSTDYRESTPVPSILRRILYVGVVFNFR